MIVNPRVNLTAVEFRRLADRSVHFLDRAHQRRPILLETGSAISAMP